MKGVPRMRNYDFSWIIIAFVLLSFLWTYFKIFRVRMTGIEADAVVTRMEEHETVDSDGLPNEYYDVYVRFQAQDGRTVNACLANSDCFLNVGDWVKIRYIPGKEDYPVLIS